jgi:hypothetical protein
VCTFGLVLIIMAAVRPLLPTARLSAAVSRPDAVS